MKKFLILAGILVLFVLAFQSVSSKPKSAIPKQSQPPKIVRQTPSLQKDICLTFDDGSQIDKTDQVLDSIAGYRPVLFRPPFGFMNNKVLSAAKKKGLKVVLWSRKADPNSNENGQELV